MKAEDVGLAHESGFPEVFTFASGRGNFRREIGCEMDLGSRNGPPSSGATPVLATSGISVGRPASGKFLAQREIRIALPHQDAAEVGMAGETDAHHVPHLAFMPIRPGQMSVAVPIGTSSSSATLHFTRRCFEWFKVAIEFIDHLEARSLPKWSTLEMSSNMS
jgi:hypothetical protein